MCNIKKNTHLAKLIAQTSLIIWDEAPVNHKYCFEALDRSVRDILLDTNPVAQNSFFGGITVVFGGDFWQTLPVIQNLTKQNFFASMHCQLLFVGKMYSPAIKRKHEIKF
jgi:hypothetical protein